MSTKPEYIKEIAEKLKGDKDWQAFEQHLKDSVDILNSHGDMPLDWDAERRSQEVLARQRAIVILGTILQPFKVDQPVKSNIEIAKYGL